MHIGGLKTIVVKEGHEQEFETRAYIVEEQYRDQAAFDSHQSSAHGKLYFPKIRAILESIQVEYFDVIVP
jgi:quinol monooxygenase YgiN